MRSDVPTNSTSHDGFSEGTCSVLTTLSEASETVTLILGDDGEGRSTLPEGITRQGGDLAVDLALFPALTKPGQSLWVAGAEVIILHRVDDGEYRAFSSDCPNHGNEASQGSEASIFESDSPAPSLEQCPSFPTEGGGDGAPGGTRDSDLRSLPLTRKGSVLHIALDS